MPAGVSPGTVIARYEAGTGVAVRLLVVSVSLRFWNCTVIGGLHAGWNAAVAVRVYSDLPFCTGTSAAVVTLALLTAFGWLPPLLMHSASPVSTTWICASSPSPASLAETVTVDPDVVKVGVPTKWGLPAIAGAANPKTAAAAMTAGAM